MLTCCARLRLRLGQCRPRHAADPGLARPSSNPTHRALYGIKPNTLQGSVALNGAQTAPTLRSCVVAARRIGRAIRQGLCNAARQALLDHQTTHKQQTTSKADPLPNSVLKVV